MKIRKTVSLLLIVIMLFSCFSICSLAAGKRYVVLGDSIAYGSGLVNARDACYGKMVADTCGFNYVNHAVPGATTWEFVDELDSKIIRSDLAKADIVSISIGGNDFLNNLSRLMFDAIVKKDYAEFDALAEGAYTNIKKVIKLIKGLNSDVVIMLQTLYNPQFGYLKDAYQQGADRINEVIYRCAFEYPDNVVVVDVASVLNGDESNFADDTMHPSAKGNELIAKEVLRTLNWLGLTKKTKLSTDTFGVDVILGPTVSKTLDYYAFFLHAFAKALGAIFTVV